MAGRDRKKERRRKEWFVVVIKGEETRMEESKTSVTTNPNLDYYLEGPRYKNDLLVQIHDFPTRFNYLTPIEDVLKGMWNVTTCNLPYRLVSHDPIHE